ncbi:hypothetical protein [Zavarzinella formosa]|uniref:hypothetical protein n=1 Tax=Zavarzinella formosa TaxID=360055 RepID=UPI000315D064|nr:hypothetical protein [Zavarzinella formosa]
MAEPTLESLAKRIEEIERKLAGNDRPVKPDWRSVIGIFGDSELARQVTAEILATREAERETARREWALEDAKAVEAGK